MRYALALVAMALLSGCSGPRYVPTDAAQAGALARCQAQGRAAGAAVRNIVESAIAETQVTDLCVQAWNYEQTAASQQRAEDRRLADQRAAQGTAQVIAAQQAENDARAQAGRDCQGARNRDACVQGIIASARMAATAQSAAAPARTAPATYQPVTGACGGPDRPCYDW